jgi:hypothetical protein
VQCSLFSLSSYGIILRCDLWSKPKNQRQFLDTGPVLEPVDRQRPETSGGRGNWFQQMENSTKSLTSLLSLPSSKFSSFKAFKFPKLSQLVVDTDDDDVPPPVPPKEPYYSFNNRSTNNIPSNMAHRARKPSASSPAPNRSTLSLASFNSAGTQDTSAPTRKSSRGSPVATLGKTLLRLTRRSPKSSKEPEGQTRAPDDNISLPWNFSVRVLLSYSLSHSYVHLLAQHSCR